MSDWIQSRVAVPAFEDEEEARVAGLLKTVLVSAMVFAILYGIAASLVNSNPMPLVGIAIVVPLWFGALVLLRLGYVTLSGLLFLSTLWAIVTSVTVIYGGLDSLAAAAYITIIFAAGLLMGVRVGLAFAAFSILASLGLLYAEVAGLLPPSLLEETPAMTWAGLATNLVLASVLLYLAVSNIIRSLERAQRNERALAQSNHELEAEIAERKRVEQALRESEEKYRTILESIEDGYYEVDLAGNLTFFNDSLCRIVGYPCSEMMGMNNREFMDRENAEVVFQAFNQVYRTGEPAKGFDWELVGQDGTRRYVEASVSLMTDANGEPTGFRGIARDVTERKRAEEALRRSEEWLRAIVEGTHALLVSVDKRGRFTYVNEAAARTVGCQPEEMIGQLYLRFIHPDDRDRVSVKFLQHSRDGKQSTSLEFRVLVTDGGIRWVNFVANPMSEAGELAGQMGLALDITRRVQTEKALRQRTIELEERNEELDAFAHTVAHDLQDPLSLVIGYGAVLVDDRASLSDQEFQRGLSIILQSGRKMSNIIDELFLLTQVRKTEVDTRRVDMAGIVAGALQRLAHLVEEQQAQIVLPDSWPAVWSYEPWIEEVWVNYLSNALKHGGRPPHVELGAEVQSDSSVRFWIRDNGPGLTEEEQARLFTPFTKLSQVRTKGHGLGLSIVRRIVEKLGGWVGVESDGVPGRGSVFYFTLPGTNEEAN